MMSVGDSSTLVACHRRQLYREWIDEGLRCFNRMHFNNDGARSGCYFPPYRNRLVNYSNARWQEIVLPIAWEIVRSNDEHHLTLFRDGIRFWTTIQNSSGSFPQYCRRDSDFAATAFSSYSVAAALNYLGETGLFLDCTQNTKLHDSLVRAGNWLSKNNETVYSNQQMVAALALLEISKFLDDSRFILSAGKKLTQVLRLKEKGMFLEKGGFDIGYSTLTLELLARYFLRTTNNNEKDSIFEAVNQYLGVLTLEPTAQYFGTGVRNTDWAVTGGFEVFAPLTSKAQLLLEEIFYTQDVRHMPDTRHVHTDLCRLCFAHDNAVVDITGNLERNQKVEYAIQDSNHHANLKFMRPFGLHRFRRWI